MNNCRVCGLEQAKAPWEHNIPSHNICPCCGCEFGYEDGTLAGVRRHRQIWLESDSDWFQISAKPEIWNLPQQLHQIPEEWL